MALADFFDKTARAASQVLSGYDRGAFEDVLNSSVVAVTFDDAATGSPEGRITLELAVNLLSRLYPRLAVVPSGGETEGLAEDLVSLARSINPKIDIESGLEGADICLSVGSTPATGTTPVVYLGSDGWVAQISTKDPQGSGPTENPFGAAAAACLGAANAFRAVFSSQLPKGNLDDDLSLSLLDYKPFAAKPINTELASVDLSESHLIGLGAIGNGAVWTLSKVKGVSGTLHLVDHEEVDLSNLQRYVLTTAADVGASKVALAADMLQDTGFAVRTHPERWGVHLAARGDWDLQRVAVAVDSVEDRIAVQAALPRWIVNAWTQPDDLGISRHAFLGDQACLACLYLPEEKRKSEAEIMAEVFGFSEEWRVVGERLYKGTPTDRAFLESIAAAQGIAIEQLLPFEGKHLRTLYQEGVCGGAVIGFGDRADDEQAEVPLAFQSALAGVMLAADLVTNAGGLNTLPPPVTTRMDLLRPLGTVLSSSRPKHPSGRCICQDDDYVRAYQLKYV
ncbi:hypothetical protein GBA63_19815 [Rubrobacter tropicus]|uniref:THIF-type NAD/FAD binding fold domain-containing protein n=1 Tax=Rubrobacter tropicus TaxID=2653851 RepID=A0A6G8QEI2_9ACTN|nr:E2 ligase fold family C protein [Rubrobacter tropicus]QIN84647.1 hypothetical protein GBA63_19815 [Rubrobacter tropicus]